MLEVIIRTQTLANLVRALKMMKVSMASYGPSHVCTHTRIEEGWQYRRTNLKGRVRRLRLLRQQGIACGDMLLQIG